jgi:hypothetical protein
MLPGCSIVRAGRGHFGCPALIAIDHAMAWQEAGVSGHPAYQIRTSRLSEPRGREPLNSIRSRRVLCVQGRVGEQVETAMPLRITVDPAASDDLLAYLQRLGADAKKFRRNVIIVHRRHRRLDGEPPHQDKTELEFVVRGWAQSRPEIRYEIEAA